MAASATDTNDSLCGVSGYYTEIKQMLFFLTCCYTFIVAVQNRACQSKSFQNDQVGRTYVLVELGGTRTAEANLLS